MEETVRVSATNGTLNQLPTIIHFNEGKEVKRLNPAVSPETLLNLPSIMKYCQVSLTTLEGKKSIDMRIRVRAPQFIAQSLNCYSIRDQPTCAELDS
jgi:hypothetical protein